MTGANTLPDDVETLKTMLREREARLDECDMQVTHLQETVESQKAALASRAAEVEHLNLLIAKLRRMQFGRKSEKLDHQIEQLELRLEDLQADKGAAPVEIPKTPPLRLNGPSANHYLNICLATRTHICLNRPGSARSMVPP